MHSHARAGRILDAGLFLHLTRTLAGVLLGLMVAGAIPGIAAEPAKEIEQQQEGDWIDARWNQTDIGNFHASILPLPGGPVAKGLSVRLGDGGKAAVAYDTVSASLRAGWTGGFLKFQGARYGLIQPPKPDGPTLFTAPALPAWGEAPVRWRGLHVRGPRVLLEYEVAGAMIRESPWHEPFGDAGVFTRAWDVGSSKNELAVTLIDATQREVAIHDLDGIAVATLAAGTNDVLLAAMTGEAARFQPTPNALKLQLLPSVQSRRVKVFITRGHPSDLSALAAFVKQSRATDEWPALARPGPARWRPLTTRGQRGFGSDAYVLDTLTVPYENPWRALFFISGVDFLPNGDAAVCTIHGDVWRVSGIDAGLQHLTWRRYATGLFQPLGLRVRDGDVFVLGRDRITRLHDENGDGEADFYESFHDGIKTSTGGHEYVTSLETDANGNFYYVDPRGLHRVATNGAGAETVAAGWRNPNGMGVTPDGRILTVAPQEGEWTPSSAICEARPGGWYGYGGPKVTAARPLGYDPPLCWIPHRVDNSGGSQVWVTSTKWGPLSDHFVHLSFGRCAQFLVLREVVDGVAQGAVVPLPGRFLSGAMRGAFHPGDGQLYVVGTRGWQTSAVRDGCLQRVRYTGKIPVLPLNVNVHSNGLKLEFSVDLERAAAEDPGSYALSQWNYQYAAHYGSKDFSVRNPDKEGHDPLEIRSARLLPGGRAVFLEIPLLGPVMQWELKYNLNSAQGHAARGEVYGSIQRLGPSFGNR